MQTSNKSPVRYDHDLIVVPEARPPRRRGAIGALVAAVIVALLVGGVIGWAIARPEVRDLQAQLAGSADQRQVAVTDVGAALVRVEALEARVSDLRAQMEVQSRAVGVLRGSNHEKRRQLTQAQRDLAAAQAELREATGPPLGDGTFAVKVIAVGATQSPARIVVDLGRWFTGSAARAAAAADGAIVHADRGNHARYFRDRGSTWRMLPLDPAATATFWRWGNMPGSSTIAVEDLQHVLRSGARWATTVSNDPFWVTVQNGRVTSLQQQRYR